MGFLYVLLAVLAACVAVTEGALMENTMQTETNRNIMVQAVNTFSKDLYRTAARVPPGNLVISPLSASLLLALTWQGAEGTTASQIRHALHLPEDQRAVSSGCQALINSLQTASSVGKYDVILRFANKLYAQRGFRLKEDFRKRASNTFGADAEELDFAEDSENSRVAINRWVEEYTASKIKDLFQKGSPSPSSLLILVNAVYLKAYWYEPFDYEKTEINRFHLTSKSQVMVSTMIKLNNFQYANIPELNATALELPYEDGRGLKMVIILPDAVDGLSQVETKLDHLNVNTIPWNVREVNISLPKFRIEATHTLDAYLQQLGVNELFTRNANLSGIADEGLYVSKAVQKTFIAVTEKGTEASAGSGGDVTFTSIPPPRVEFHADHPFLFLITKEEVIVFMGKVTNPLHK